MAKTGAQLTDSVQTNVGRLEDPVLIDNTLVTEFLNEAQRKIADEIPGMHSLTFKNTTSFDTTQVLQYNIRDITVGDLTPVDFGDTTANTVNRIFNVHYLDDNESRRLTFVHTDEWDKISDPTNVNLLPFTRANSWTRRGDFVEIRPICLTENCDNDLRFDGDYYPTDFTTETACKSELRKADEGLVFYATSRAWGAIGGESINEAKWLAKFNAWLEDYKQRNDDLYEWDGDIFSDAGSVAQVGFGNW